MAENNTFVKSARVEFFKQLLGDSISIFTIMNPLSVGVIMLSLLDEKTDKKEITRVAWKSTQSSFVAMLIFFFAGTYVFHFFGINTGGLRLFGGVILFTMGLNMVQGHGKKVNHNDKDQAAALDREDISVVPLSIPVTVGAGLATTLITMSAAAKEWNDFASGALAILICCFASLLILRRMPFIKKTLGVNGLKIFNRLMGLVVGSLAVQMMVSGVMILYKTYLS